MQLLAQVPDPSNVIDSATRYSWEAGVLAFLVIAVVTGGGWLAWKLGWYIVYKLLGNEEKSTKGLIGDWVDNEKGWRTELTRQIATQTDRLEAQTEACTAHVTTVQTMGESLAAQIAAAQAAGEAAKLAQEAAKMAADQMTEGNKALKHIDTTLAGRTDLLKHTAEDVAKMKACIFHWCDMCQAVAKTEFPNAVGEVSAYANAIKKTINDEKVV